MIFATCFWNHKTAWMFVVDLEVGGPIFFSKSKPSNGQPLLFLDIRSVLRLHESHETRRVSGIQILKSGSFFSLSKYKVSKEWV